jgi:hypothetical protein
VPSFSGSSSRTFKTVLGLHLILARASLGLYSCTRGQLPLPDEQILYTLELAWVPDAMSPGGAHSTSCVPPGLYSLVRHNTAKHPRSFALVNAALGVIHEPDPAYPNARTACLLHIANEVNDLEGCIGMGMSASGCWLSSSAVALGKFNTQVPWVEGHTLEIVAPPS